MAIDLFQMRTMLAVLDQMKPPRSFLRNTFFNRTEPTDSENIDIDIRKGKRRVAMYVSPLLAGKPVDRTGWETRSFKAPYVKEMMVSTAQDYQKRRFGGTIYGPKDSPASRAAMQAGEDLAELDNRITRLEELQAAKLLTTGAYNCVGEGVSLSLDFGLDTTHKPILSGGALWSATTSKPMDDMRGWRRLMVQDSGMAPTDCILSPNVVDAFLDNTQVKDHFNKWWMNFGSISVQNAPNDEGVIFLGRIAELNMNFWSYEEWYVDPADGVEKPMIPDNLVIMTSRNARSARHYGVIQDIENDTLAAVPRYPRSWISKNPSARYVELQSAPALAFHQVDAHLVADVL
jgi:hypothetical protein